MPAKTNKTGINIIIYCNDAKLILMIWIGCATTKTGIYNTNIFFGNDTGSKKTIFVPFIDHGPKLMGQPKKN